MGTHESTFDDFKDALWQLCDDIAAKEVSSSSEEIRGTLTQIRSLVRQSPLLQRAQDWPRGYQGDFETINYIIEAHNRAKPGTAAYAIEQVFLDSPICQQHRNKVAQQARLIRTVVNQQDDATILSIGCGTSEDLVQCLDVLQHKQCSVSLMDIDKDALAFSACRLSAVAGQLTLIEGNIYKKALSLRESYDLILIGGVFDYVSDKYIVSILKTLQHRLKPGGKLFFTNISKNNPFRIPMEYLSNWFLLERNTEEIKDLLQKSLAIPCEIYLSVDDSGLTHLVTVQRRASNL